MGRSFLILDAHERLGDAWRERWDSLRLFTPAYLSALPGLVFPGRGSRCPTKDEMADYLETYAARFDLSVRIGTHVDSITKIEDRFLVSVNDHSFEADNVVLATGGHPGSEPTRPGSLLDRLLTLPFWFFLSRVASVTNPVGRRMRPQMIKTTLPLVRVKPKDLDAAGVVRVPGTVAVPDGRPILEDGRVLDVRNVGWCTGYRSVFDWIEVDVLDQEGRPMHERGTTAEPGLYFVGLFFLSSLAPSLVGGVGRDASYIARHIAARPSTGSGRIGSGWGSPRALRHV